MVVLLEGLGKTTGSSMQGLCQKIFHRFFIKLRAPCGAASTSPHQTKPKTPGSAPPWCKLAGHRDPEYRCARLWFMPLRLTRMNQASAFTETRRRFPDFQKTPTSC
jgi:hypothetical protein